jgi:preprotein translocase subunit SecA
MFLSFKKFRQIFHRLRGRHIEFDLKLYQALLKEINKHGRKLETIKDHQLKEMSANLVAKARGGVDLDGLLIEAFALVREASRRVLGLRPFDVQIIGGLAMHQGKAAEMQTGEGKTLVALLPVYLNALTGRGVHVLTFNDYLAHRDANWMGPIYRYLGLSVGFIQEGMSIRDKQKAYMRDITYATAKEAGFDYLRDCLCLDKNNRVHRPFYFAIVDEADSILIDEARIPLVLAGSTAKPETDPYRMAGLVRNLECDVDFNTDEYSRNIHLTETGLDRVEAMLACGSLHDPKNLLLLTELNLALHAEVLLRRDVDYIIRNGKVEIVDEFTGRGVEDRHWPNGLQAAVEAKEGLQLQSEGMIRGSITLIHFMQLYPKICGMTATAQAAAEEFKEFYDLNVVVIPPNQPCIRIDYPDVIFTHKEAKRKALIEEITRVHTTGRPILVGTSSVGESEQLAAALQEAGVTSQVLNAKNDELEAKIVAQAGSLNAVTISTNMAGRGTDIRLGGDQGLEHQKVYELGGLYVVGTNRHESRRIDNQLRGRAGRQGDPGVSRFFISLEDDLIDRYGIQELIPPEHRLCKQDDPIDDLVIGREIARAQRIIEGQNLEIRQTLWKYSSVIEEQRRIVHQMRKDVLLGKSLLLLLATQTPRRYSDLRSIVGEEVLQRVEKQITLFHIDRCWAEYLARIAHIRDGIHLFSFSGQNPLDEFHKIIGDAFQNFMQTINDEIVKTFESAEITEDGIDMEEEGLKGPSSTWTYLINDNPLGDWSERFSRGVRKIILKGFKSL